MDKCFLTNIKDISFQDGTVTMTKEQCWTVDSIEVALKKLPYNGERGVKDELVENAKLPSMAVIFYRLLFNNGEIPTEDVFLQQYLYAYFRKLDKYTHGLKEEYRGDNEHNIFSTQGIKGRVLRSYPSLIRDFHFYVLCSESKIFDKVIYSLATDYFSGLDLEVWYKGEQYYASLFTNTSRSKDYKSRKYNRHAYGVKEVCLSIDWTSRNQMGPFWLYGQEHIDQLLEEIKAIMTKEA